MRTSIFSLLFLSILTLLSSDKVNAQQSRFGLKGGANFSTIGGDANDTELRTSFHVGAFVAIQSSNKLVIQPELLYNSMGTSFKNNNDKTRFEYLSMPIMFRVFPIEGISLDVGPQVSLLLASETDYGFFDIDNSNELTDVDFSVGLGMTYQSQDIMFGVRYNLGLSDTWDSTEEWYPNRVVQLSLGFLF